MPFTSLSAGPDPLASPPAPADALLAGLLDAAMDAIVAVDGQQRIVFCNPAAEGLFGWPRQALLQQPLARLIEGDFFGAQLQPLAARSPADPAARQAARRRVRGLHRSGQALALDASVSRRDTPAGTLFTLVLRECADAASVPAPTAAPSTAPGGDAAALAEALRLANEEFAAFSYAVSHGLRSPLNIINGFSHLLAKKLGTHEGASVQNYLTRIQDSATQMGQLIEGLLTLSKVSRAVLQREPLALAPMAARTLEKLQARDTARQVAVQIESDLQADGDAQLVALALEHLLDNAWKFTAKTEGAQIAVGRQRGPDGETVFFVRDNGAGFDMAYADKLFKPFQRLHAVTDFPGAGMGLTMASRLIGRHGGRLWAEAAPEQGAQFFFTLPG